MQNNSNKATFYPYFRTLVFISVLATIFAFLTFPNTLKAYIPPAPFILQKSAETHGNGVYEVVLEVQIPLGSETLQARETWTILDGENMSVKVEGLKNWQEELFLVFVYNQGQKVSFSIDGDATVSQISKEFAEPYFHVRSKKGFADLLLRSQMVPRTVLAEAPIPKSIKDYKYESPSFVKLDRVEMQPAFEFSLDNPKNNRNAEPALWIDQDNFGVLKIRWPSHAEVRSDEMETFERDFQFPKKRSIRWSDRKAHINVMRIIKLKKDIPVVKALKIEYWRELFKNHKLTTRQPTHPIVEEFYSRFR